MRPLGREIVEHATARGGDEGTAAPGALTPIQESRERLIMKNAKQLKAERAAYVFVHRT